ncbi:MAG: hypothetical protein AB1733_09990 [Thermodesulfobacteriota bacterium]
MHTVLESDIVSRGLLHPVVGVSALPLTSSSTSRKIVQSAHRPILEFIERLGSGRFSVKPLSPSAHGDHLFVTALRGTTAGRTTVVVIPRHRGRNRK